MIKGLCVELGKDDAKFIFEKATPQAGRYYYLEDVTFGSGNQNRLFHALLTVFWTFMFDTNTFVTEDNGVIYNLSSDCMESLKDLLKSKYGQKFSHINYVDENFKMIKVTMKKPKDWVGDYDPWSLIPDYVIEDFNNGNSARIKGVLISWSDYTMPQRHKLITKVFQFMDLYGVESNKYEEIKTGLIEIEEERKNEAKRINDYENNRQNEDGS